MKTLTPLSPGRQRGLAQCADERGIFSIVALDHRAVVKDAFKNPPAGSTTFQQAAQFKRDVVRTLAPCVTAFLLDPALGAGPVVVDGSLPGRTGLVVAVEETGYAGESTARVSRVAQGWSAEKIKRLGASAVKLLVYYHPQAASAAGIRELVRQVAGECKRLDIPLFLEPLTYSTDPIRPKLSNQERREAILRTTADLSPLGADVLKLEFPVLASVETDEAVWAAACQEVTRASAIPWVLLSAAVDYEVFLRQVTIACQAGASGMLAGRAIWKEALNLSGAQRETFLRETAVARMGCLNEACRKYARPYLASYPASEVDEDWYQSYPDFSA